MNNLIELNSIKDERGLLVSLESLKNVPFEIKRVYYLTNLKNNIPRGFHAHKNLKQLMVCVSGSCDLILDFGLGEIRKISLDRPEKAALVESDVWREMHNFSENCVLLVLASELYDELDYIRNYEEFEKYIENKKSENHFE